MDQGSGRLSAENTWPPQAWVTAEFLVKQEMAWETALARSAQGSCSQDGLTAQGLSGPTQSTRSRDLPAQVPDPTREGPEPLWWL